jgi:hypothetical protein
MYCSIQEAWPEYNFTKPSSINNSFENFNQIKTNPTINYDNESRPELVKSFAQQPQQISSIQPQQISSIQPQQISSIQPQQLQQPFDQQSFAQPQYVQQTSFVRNDNIIYCDDFLNHLNTCDSCKRNISNKFVQNKLFDILKLNPQLRETIIIFLIGIVILMVLNLFYK